MNAPLDPRSPALAAELLRQVLAAGTWINTATYSVPVYVVDQSTPTVYVQLDTPNSMYTNATDAAQLQHDLRWVPIPAGAVPSNGTDKHMVIWRPSTDMMWDLWRVENYGTPASPNWHAYWGAKITSVSTSDGIDPRPFGATASGLPAIGGLIQASELASGRIDHVIAIAIPDVARWRYVWPANRTDGLYTGSNAIPEGARFRLDPKLDVASLHLSPTATAIALAAQRYGIVVRDRGGAVAFFAQDPRPLGIPDPYPRLFGGYPSAALSGFPWGRLQALPEG